MFLSTSRIVSLRFGSSGSASPIRIASKRQLWPEFSVVALITRIGTLLWRRALSLSGLKRSLPCG